MPTITALNIYPVKSCRGIALQRATLAPSGFLHDRQWLIVRPGGQFLTQREEPRLATISTALDTNGALTLRAPEGEPLRVAADANAGSVEVKIWRDTCAAFDAGDAAAGWLQSLLGQPYRLVRFDTSRPRYSNPDWTGDIQAPNLFSDGYAYLVISQASLDDLNGRLEKPLPMNRFRPSIVVDGLAPYGEDEVHEFVGADIRLRRVKPCTRCVITTTDQDRAVRDGDEPLRTLRGYRFSRELKGVLFGQNLIMVAGAGSELRVGQQLEVSYGPG